MIKIDINEANGNLNKIINDLENNVVNQYIVYKDNKPCAIIGPYVVANQDDVFPEIGDKNWDELDDDMKKYWKEFGEEEI